MKRIVFFIFVLSVSVKLNAQSCLISGQIKNDSTHILTLNLLYAGAHYRNQSVDCNIKPGGAFKQSITLPYPIFVLLTYNGQERRLLLSPGRNLHLVFDANDVENMRITGAGSKENILLHQLKIGDVPFFMKDKGEGNRYAKMSMDSLQREVLDVTKQHRIAADEKIAAAGIPVALQKILSTEYRYVNQCYLYDLAQNDMRWAKNKDQEAFQQKVIHIEPLPDSTILVNCLYANMMLDNYIRNEMMNAGKNIRKDSVNGKNAIEQLFRMPFSEIMKQAEKYGERYMLKWLFAKYNLVPDLRDKVLFNGIMECCDNKLFATAAVLQDTLEHYYPNSNYIAMTKGEVQKMQAQLEKETGNQKIIFHAGKKIDSLKVLTELYKGSVIYLDIWGTWCGPCRDEMKYAAALKNRFAGKDIVFVYLDMDEENKEDAWKEMARMYGLEGEHYRMNNTEIQACWKEIEAEGGETNRYPTYVLFDRNGKMIKANAARPSDGEVLYRQLNEVYKNGNN